MLKAVTREEAERYASRTAFYREKWQQMDPLMVGIKRFALDRKGGEKIVVDAFVAPFVEEKYGGMLSILGPPTTDRISAAPGDLVNVQAYVAGGMLAQFVPPHFLFLGLQDSDALAAGPKGDGMMQTLQMLQSAPGYLGAWPKPGFLDMLPLGLLGAETDRFGFSKYPLGIWRRQWEGFSALSFNRDLLAGVSPHLKPVKTDIPAQLRIQVKDLTGTKLSGWVNDMYYERAFKTSTGNTRLLLAMTDQLHVPSDEALATAEKLLDVKLVLPSAASTNRCAKERRRLLGIDQVARPRCEVGARGPDEFHAPLLNWFRGLDGYLTMDDDKMIAHVELDMQRHEPETKIELPLFNLFNGKKDPKKEEPKKDDPEEARRQAHARRGAPRSPQARTEEAEGVLSEAEELWQLWGQEKLLAVAHRIGNAGRGPIDHRSPSFACLSFGSRSWAELFNGEFARKTPVAYARGSQTTVTSPLARAWQSAGGRLRRRSSATSTCNSANMSAVTPRETGGAEECEEATMKGSEPEPSFARVGRWRRNLRAAWPGGR